MFITAIQLTWGSTNVFFSRHYPTTNFTQVADTPENMRLQKQTKAQSQVFTLHIVCLSNTLILTMYESKKNWAWCL